MKCFYHSADLDGACAGAIVKMKHPECELLPINYGDPFPWESIEPQEVVYMVDFSLPLEEMHRLNGSCRLIWIDHHKSALLAAVEAQFIAWEGQKTVSGRAGCELTWEFCYPATPVPLAVELLGRYDVWDQSDPQRWAEEILPFQYGMRNHPDTSPANQVLWAWVINKGFAAVAGVTLTGRTLLEYEGRQNAMYARTCAFDTEIDGLRAVAVNKGLCNALLFAEVYDPERHDVMCSFYQGKDRHWKVSLYAEKPEVDVSVLAKARGGGGHKGAAGFRCEVLPF